MKEKHKTAIIRISADAHARINKLVGQRRAKGHLGASASAVVDDLILSADRVILAPKYWGK